MFESLSGAVVARRRLIVVVGILFAVVAAVVGGNVASRLSDGGFDDPNSESAQAGRILEEEFGTAQPNLVLVVSTADVDHPESLAAGLNLTAELADSSAAGVLP